MPDEPPSDDRFPDEPTRDDGLAEQLAVTPLDDLTRRRLITRALDAPPATAESTISRRARRLVAVAAVVAAVVAGGLVLSLRGGDRAPTTAARAPDAAEKRGAASPQHEPFAASSAPDQGSAAPVAVADAGEFGDLTRRANRARLLRTLAAEITSGASEATRRTTARSTELLGQLRSAPCAEAVLPAVVTAVATGRYGDRIAVVGSGVGADGRHSVVAVVLEPCNAHLIH